MRAAQRTRDEVVEGLVSLEREVGTLATDALRVTPRWLRLLGFHRQIGGLEERLATHLTTFMNLDADLVVHAANTPRDGSPLAASLASLFPTYFGVRDSTRGLLDTASATISELRTELAFRQSMIVALLALVVSLVGLFWNPASK